MTINIIPLIILAVCFVLGFPIAFSLILAVTPYFFMQSGVGLVGIVQKMVANTESTSLMAIPFFVMAGSIMNYSGVTARLMNLANLLVGHLTGGLGHVNVLLSTLMGGLSGSGAADASMECKLLVPEMVKHGYSKSFSGAVTAASCVITPIIPPGVGLIVYSFICQVSVGKILCAGYIPGLMLALAMMLVVHIVSKKRKYTPSRTRIGSGREILHAIGEATWALAIPFILVLGLRLGICTATEGGAIIAVYSLFVGVFVYREITWKNIPKILLDAVLSTATVMLIMCASNAFAFYLSWEGIPRFLSNIVIQISGGNKYVFLLMVNFLFLLLGMFIDGTAAMIILAPLFAPVATMLGVDPIHFGIIIVLNITLGGITPPFGTYLYLVAGTIHEKVDAIIKDLMPFIIACIIVLLLITYIPDLVMFIPNLIY